MPGKSRRQNGVFLECTNKNAEASGASNLELPMAAKRQCPLANDMPTPPMEFLPRPRSARDVVVFLQYAAALGLANSKMVAHLSEMGTLFPEEMLDAYQAVRAKQVSDN